MINNFSIAWVDIKVIISVSTTDNVATIFFILLMQWYFIYSTGPEKWFKEKLKNVAKS